MDELQKQKIQLFVEETKIEANSFVDSFPSGFRKLFFGLVLLSIPLFFTARFVSAKIYQNQHRFDVVSAHPAYIEPEPVQILKVRSIQQVGKSYAAYALIKNPNTDLVAPDLKYTFTFVDSNGREIATQSSETFVLAGEQKYILLPRIELASAPDPIQGVKISIPDPIWKKRLVAPATTIKIDPPTWSDVSGSLDGDRGFRIQGKFTINGIQNVRTVKLYGVVFGENNEIIALSQTAYFNMQPNKPWDYSIFWPIQIQSRVKDVQVFSETDTLDYGNFY